MVRSIGKRTPASDTFGRDGERRAWAWVVVLAFAVGTGGCLFAGSESSEAGDTRDAAPGDAPMASDIKDGGGDTPPDMNLDVGDTGDEADMSGPFEDVSEDSEGGGECSDPEDCPDRGACFDGECQPPTCSDGIRNQSEPTTDCGGPCDNGCVDGDRCLRNEDCASGVCKAQECQAPTCEDGVKNGDETDVDCGGPDCGGCGECESCNSASDCADWLTACDDGKCGLSC